MMTKVKEIDIEAMMAGASEAAQLLKSLGNPERLLILCQLSKGEYCVGDLESILAIPQPTLSQQLGRLRGDELVTTRREGKMIYYSIASKEALALMEVLYKQFCGKKRT